MNDLSTMGGCYGEALLVVIHNITEFGAELSTRLQLWQAAVAPTPRAITWQSEPRSVGSFARGKQLIAGNLLFSGHLLHEPDTLIWEVEAPSEGFLEKINSFSWLDDLACVKDAEARELAKSWLMAWIDRFSQGTGIGWNSELVGRRLIRWINHAPFVLDAMSPDESRRFFKSLGTQAAVIARKWRHAPVGLARFEALTALLYAGLSMAELKRYRATAQAGILTESRKIIALNGGIETRNPEELLGIFTLLTWAVQSLVENDMKPQQEHLEVIQQIKTTLVALRHVDGGLARFHGGGSGRQGEIDRVLEIAQQGNDAIGLHMGYSRLCSGSTSIIADTAPPPVGAASANGHASTLGFELVSGVQPLIVNCGSGLHFGDKWHKAGRATPSHSTLGLDGFSSSRLKQADQGSSHAPLLASRPENVQVQTRWRDDTIVTTASHDGYLDTHGLTHMRQLELGASGHTLEGSDTLAAVSDVDRAQFDKVLDAFSLQGVDYSIRFHVHPDVEVSLDLGGTAVSLAMKSGEIWVFRYKGRCDMAIDSSVYLEKTRLNPRNTKQVVLSGVAVNYATSIQWSLSKAQDTFN